MKLTETSVKAATLPASGQTFYRDEVLTCFALRVTSGGARSFIVEKRVNGKARRVTLGQWPAMKVEAARRAAQKLIGEMADGRDPVAQRRGAEAAAVTLDEVFEMYLRERRLKPNSVRIYRRIVASIFADWRRKRIQAILRDMVVERHIELTEKNGPAYANLAMRLLGALFAFAGGKYQDDEGRSLFPQNPVKRLSQIKRWNRIERRQTVIQDHELKAWYGAVETVREGAGSTRR
jgi:hypothetical protein